MYALPSLVPAQVLMYLRKSRTDDPALTVAETLSRHEQMLDDFSQKTWGPSVLLGRRRRGPFEIGVRYAQRNIGFGHTVPDEKLIIGSDLESIKLIFQTYFVDLVPVPILVDLGIGTEIHICTFFSHFSPSG